MLKLAVSKRSTYVSNLARRSFAKASSKEGFDEEKAETESLARFLQTARKAAGYKFLIEKNVVLYICISELS